MANYKTQQGDMIKEYMQKRAGEHVTANEIMFYFQQLDIEIGMTTIYRHLNKLVKQGLVKKFYIDDRSAACFEYAKDGCEKNTTQYFHLKCIECDSLIHFKCQEILDWQKHIEQEHGFEIDSERTVFYGICPKCKKLKNKNNTHK